MKDEDGYFYVDDEGRKFRDEKEEERLKRERG